MTSLVVHPANGPLIGSVPVPSDKSIGHRALLLGALCDGPSIIRGFSGGEDNIATANALRAMGVPIEERSATEWLVRGVGLRGLREPSANLDCGNSGTTMRLLVGLLCAQPFSSTLVGDASLSRRPMLRVAAPLRARRARVEGAAHRTKQGEITAPIVVGPVPQEGLGELEVALPVPSAQVKSAVLLSGLYALGPTFVSEPMLSRDHTERMLATLGAPIETLGPAARLDPAGWNGSLRPFELELPGDLSAAAFLLVAATILAGSQVSVRNVGVNPTRTGILEIVRDMGGDVMLEPHGDRAGEPIGDLHARFATLRAMPVGGEVVTRAIDEMPLVCALAARAEGRTRVSDASELRIKESDRIATMARLLESFGVSCTERPDGIDIVGTSAPLAPVDFPSHGDHRVAMTGTVLALLATGPSRIRDANCIGTSFPRFVGTLRALGAKIEVEES